MAEVAYIGPGGRGSRRRPLLRKLVGDVLRRTRREQRRTLADVARAARVSMPYLSEIERGRKEASSEVLGAVCGALRIELADLLAEVRHDLIQSRPAGVRPQPRTDATKQKAEPTASVVSLDAARQRRAEAAPGGRPFPASRPVRRRKLARLAEPVRWSPLARPSDPIPPSVLTPTPGRFGDVMARAA